MKYLLAALLMALPGSVCYADLDAVMAEPNLEKRSEKALDHAERVLDASRKAYQASDYAGFKTLLAEMQSSVELSHKSLRDTGKSARRSPKYFKKAEMRLRSILKQMESLKADVGVDDRPLVETVAKRVNDIHDEILLAIMTKKS
jgi:hypothetical protein